MKISMFTKVIVEMIMILVLSTIGAHAAPPSKPTLAFPGDNTLINGSMVTFSWNSVPDAASYNLKVSTSPSSVLVNTTVYTWTSYTLSILPDNGKWVTWQVSACNAQGECSDNSVSSFKNGPSAAPTTPSLISPTQNATVAGPTFTFRWTTASRATSHIIEIGSDSQFTTFYDSVEGTDSAVINMPDNGLTYFWRVAAKNEKGTTYSAVNRYFTSLTGPPAVPVLSEPANGQSVSDLFLFFGWGQSYRAADYNLQIATDPTFNINSLIYADWVGRDVTSASVNGLLKNGQTYYWRVFAWNATPGPIYHYPDRTDGTIAISNVQSFIYQDGFTCTPTTDGMGSGVLSDIKYSIPTCYETLGGDRYYYLYDVSRRGNGRMGPSSAIMTKDFYDGWINWDNDNNWAEPLPFYKSSIDAHVYAGKVYEYLNNSAKGWQLNSYDGTGISMQSAVEQNCVYSNGKHYNNASWSNGARVVSYCSGADMFTGSLDTSKGTSGSMDVVAHEWGHAITDNAASGRPGELKYEYQSGALSEAFSDWLGVAVEQFYGNNSWTIGEDIYMIRDLSNPSNPALNYGIDFDYRQPDTYKGVFYRDLNTGNCTPPDQDDCGVHTNSGVPNKMFYLLASDGSHTHPTSNITVHGLGIDKAMTIAYRANMERWSTTESFPDALTHMVQAAQEIANNNENSNEVYQVKNAWAAVRVGTLPTLTTSVSPSNWGTISASTDVSGGTSGNGSYEWGREVTVVATPNSGYAFVSWTDENGNMVSANPSIKYPVSGNRTLTASFVILTSPIPYVSPTSKDFGTMDVGISSASYTVQITNRGLEALSISGVSLSNATDFTIGSNTCTQPLSQNASCNVQITFTPNSEGAKSSTLNIQTNASSTPSVSLMGTGRVPSRYSITTSSGGTVTLSSSTASTQTFTIAPAPGYKIVNVIIDNTSKGAIASYTFTDIYYNHSIKAEFTTSNTATYAVSTYAISMVGWLAPYGTINVREGGSQSFTVERPYMWYYPVYVIGCGGSLTGDTYTTGPITADCTVMMYRAPAYRFNLRSISSGGTVSWPGGHGSGHDFRRRLLLDVPIGADFTFTFTPDAGRHIKNVYIDGVPQAAAVGASVYSYTFNNVSRSHRIEARFASTYSLTVLKAGSGSGEVKSEVFPLYCDGQCEGEYAQGVVETLSVASTPGTEFVGWSGGGCSGTGSCTVTMNSDTAVTAVFTSSPAANTTVSAGGRHNVVIRADGTLWAWGDNVYGQLGDGTTESRLLPVKVGTFTGWASISAGEAHTTAIRKDGTLWAWGRNDLGQLGDGTTSGRLSPIQIGADADWLAVSAGDYHTMAIKTNGTLWAWGDNSYGQLGDGTTTSRTAPVLTAHGNWVAVSAGVGYTAALQTDGTLWAWGRNDFGQLGVATTSDSLLPVQVGTDTYWYAVSAGDYHILALKTDGTLWAWGDNIFGQLGDGTTDGKLSPVQVGADTGWTAVSARLDHGTALKSNGTLWAWGLNDYGQVGDGTTVDKLSPVMIGTDADWEVISTGSDHVAALKRDGSLWTWGGNYSGQLGNGTMLNKSAPEYVSGRNTNPWISITSISSGGGNVSPSGTVAVDSGSNQSFLLMPFDGYHAAKVVVDGIPQGSIGSYTFANVTSSHILDVTFEQNSYTITRTAGYGGNIVPGWSTVDSQTFSIAPNNGYYIVDVKIDGISQGAISSYTFTNIVGNHTIEASFAKWPVLTIIKSGTGSGTVAGSSAGMFCGNTCSGSFLPGTQVVLTAVPDNDFVFSGWFGGGCTGKGNCTVTLNSNTKVIATFAPSYSSVTATALGNFHTAAIKADGTLWTWGANWYGELGNGTVYSKNFPEQVGIDSDWFAVSAGDLHTVALKSNGTLWAWGYNYYGQLGDGSTTNKSSPVQIGTDRDWAAISTGIGYTLALKDNGTLWAWGYNNYGELGDGTTIAHSSPVQIGTDSEWVSIAAGTSHAFALKVDGTLWGWGDNWHGQLGDGTTFNHKLSPVRIGSDHDWAMLSDRIALKKSGALWTWGTAVSLLPAQIGMDTDWTVISSSGDHSVATKANGTLWGWGTNDYGQLGNGSTTDVSLPVQIGSDSDWALIAAEWSGTAAVKANGTLWIWGSNSLGQIGDGTTVEKHSPEWMFGRYELRPTYTITSTASLGGTISPGSASLNYGSSMSFTILPDTGHHIVDVKVDGVSIGPDYSYYFRYLTSNHTIEAIFAVNTYTLNITKLGNGSGTVTSNPLGLSCGADCSKTYNWGTTVSLTSNAMSGSTFAGWLSGGCSGTGICTLTISGDMTIEVGFSSSYTPTASIAAGDAHSFVVKTDGTLWAWGDNSYGQLGDGTTNGRLTPIQIGTGWARVAAGSNHTIALKTDGTLWAWGDNSYGQLGDGTTTNRLSPVKIGTDTNWTAVSAGYAHTVALKVDGTLWAWGSNVIGQLGDGTATDRLSPVQIGTETNWTAAAARDDYTLALKTDGTLWAWGTNMYGQLGDGGVTMNRLSPMQIGTDTNWAKIFPGGWHTLALKTDGTIWTWGLMGWDVMPIFQASPDSNWTTGAAGYSYTAAIKTDGTLWEWGFSWGGVLGDWTGDRLQIGMDTDWAAVAVGWDHAIAIKNNGTLWSWGSNYAGQLGDGTTTDRYSPVPLQ